MSGSGSGSRSGLSPSSSSGSRAAPSSWGMSAGDSGRCALQATCLLHGGVTEGVSGVVSAIGTVSQLFLGVSGGLTMHGCSAEGGFETGSPSSETQPGTSHGLGPLLEIFFLGKEIVGGREGGVGCREF